MSKPTGYKEDSGKCCATCNLAINLGRHKYFNTCYACNHKKETISWSTMQVRAIEDWANENNNWVSDRGLCSLWEKK